MGARNAQNYALLTKLGEAGLPVLLKRGPASKVEEWIGAAEYILSNGNGNVILCERGIVSSDSVTRYTLDVGGLSAMKQMTHLPVGADPSHAAGRSALVAPHALAALGAGADFLLVEVHDDPKIEKSDSAQQLNLEQFSVLMGGVKRLRCNGQGSI